MDVFTEDVKAVVDGLIRLDMVESRVGRVILPQGETSSDERTKDPEAYVNNFQSFLVIMEDITYSGEILIII